MKLEVGHPVKAKSNFMISALLSPASLFKIFSKEGVGLKFLCEEC